MKEAVLFHVDMDAFYASVEQCDNPSLRGKPVIVGGTSTRGVVSACSYEARTFGVHSAMPMFQARIRCPQGVFVQGRMKRYEEVSGAVMDILGSFAPEVQQISIDEAFLVMTGTEGIYGAPLEAGRRLKQLIRDELQLTISVGIGPSRFIAKMASDAGKPDGLFQVLPGEEQLFVNSLPLSKLWGVGPKTIESLRSMGCTAPAHLQRYSEAQLRELFSPSLGSYLYRAVRGIDPGILMGAPKSRSISNETTFEHDISDIEVIKGYVLELSHQVMFRTMQEHLVGCTPFVKYKLATMQSFTCQQTIREPVLNAHQLYDTATKLLLGRWDGSPPLRLVGVGLSSLTQEDTVQQSLFEDEQSQRQRDVEQAVLRLRERGNRLSKASSLARGFEKKQK